MRSPAFDTIDTDGNLILTTRGAQGRPAMYDIYFRGAAHASGNRLAAIRMGCFPSGTAPAFGDLADKTDWRRTADQYFVWLTSLMQMQKVDVTISRVIVSATVPRVVFSLRVLADRWLAAAPLSWASLNANCPQPR
jgi:hypothetical protein